MRKKMTAHWSQRDHWLPDEMKDGFGWPGKHEIWDGTRLANLAYFLNLDAVWTLPVRCTYPRCNNVFSYGLRLTHYSFHVGSLHVRMCFFSL